MSDRSKAAQFDTYTYNGVTFQATAPRQSTRDDKKYMRDVRYDGDERAVHWGQPGEQMERDVPESREAFNSRHSCSEKSDPFAPGFQACWHWNTTSKATMKTDYAVKYIGDPEEGRVGGYLVVWGDPARKDLQGEYFTPDTEFQLDYYPARPALYHHGLDGALKSAKIGTIDKLKSTDIGLWAEAQLDMRNEYVRMLREMVEKGLIGWSSGSLPQLVEVESDGRIKAWPIVEGSLTPAPAEYRQTNVGPLPGKYYKPALDVPASATHESDIAAKNATAASADDDKQSTTKATSIKYEAIKMDMSKIRETLMQLVEMVNASMGEAMDDETMKTVLSANTQAIVDAYVKGYHSSAAKKQEKIAALTRKSIADMRNADVTTTKKDAAGGRVSPARNISVSEPRKFAGMDGTDMALGLSLLMQPATNAGLNVRAQDVASEGYIKTMLHKIAGEVDKYDDHAIKSIMPYKADELNATDIVGQGLEWVPEWWASTVWEEARQETRLLSELTSRGAMSYNTVQGDTWHFPREGNDPALYTRAQANNVDSTGRPEATVQISAFGTGEVTGPFGEQATAIGITRRLIEDSIIDPVREARRKINLVITEGIEESIINGDTETAANTNINKIDGTPAPVGQLDAPYYLVFDGLRKNAFDAGVAQQLNAGGTLTWDTYNSLYKLMPNRAQSRRSQMLFIINPDVDNATVALPEFKTDDVKISGGTAHTGEFNRVRGVDILNTDFLPLATTAGKVSVTSSNNTLGSIVCVYAPYVGFAWKRQITIDTGFFPLSGTQVWVASIRWALAFRGADAVSLAYNVAV